MRILLIGKNDGSHITRTVKCLKSVEHRAVGMTFRYSRIVDYLGIKAYHKWQCLFYYLRFIYETLRADVVHLWSVQVPFIVRFLKLINKPFVIEWTGSDVRIPDLMTSPYYPPKDYEYKESREISLKNQKGFEKVINITSSPVLIEHIVNRKVYIPHRLHLEDYRPFIHIHSPLRVAHASSARGAKGTEQVLKAIEGLPIEFDLIENTDHQNCLRRISDCDLFLGQFVWGEHGMAELEAMAMGKPVLCYTNHKLETGVIDCTPELIREWIEMFIKCPDMVLKEGRKAREFVESQNINKLIDVYNQAIYDQKTIHSAEDFLKYQENKYKLFPELYFKENY